MRRLALVLASIMVAIFMLAPAVPTFAADVLKDACSSKGAGSSPACQTKTTSNPLTGDNGLLMKITRIISYLAGAASIILIVISGLMYVIADGDAGRLQSARTTLVYAVVGVVIVIMAQAIIRFVILIL